MDKITENLCSAIDIIVDKKIQDAKYDKTIQAIVKSCEDATIGKYKVQYQDSVLYAYSTNVETTYSTGSMVYVLIPGNDIEKDKTILGTVEKLGINYAPPINPEDMFNIIGKNCIIESSKEELYSYRENQEYVLYNSSLGENENNKIKIDIFSLEEYIRKSSQLIIAAFFRTDLPYEQREQGNYGIKYDLIFKDNTNGNNVKEISFVTRSYVLDIGDITGDPYGLQTGKRQAKIFDIDGINFERIDKISIFAKDFPHKDPTRKADIFISDLEILGAEKMPESELSSCGISFITPEGTFFDDKTEKLPITAQFKIKGRIVNTNIQKIDFYWFIEDVSVMPNTEYYNKYGKRGWRCLNSFNVIAGTEESPRQVVWVPAKDTYEINKNLIISKESRIKCVVIYDNNSYSKIITIKNISSDLQISIESDCGTEFYFDSGKPTLTCIVKKNDEEVDSSEYVYQWVSEDAFGNMTPILEKTEVNHETKEETAYNNKLYYVAINQITNFLYYKCSVFKKVIEGDHIRKIFQGTASITLKNKLNTENGYSLVINNGVQVYQYDEYGVSPASPAQDKPIIIPTLSFTIYNNLGQPIEDKLLKNCDIIWKVPKEKSMIVPKNKDNIENNYYIYRNQTILDYGIQNKYYYDYNNNDIELIVKYKDLNLAQKTNLDFVKQGDPGTNGTLYTCKIVLNKDNSNKAMPDFPYIQVCNKNGKEDWQWFTGNKIFPFTLNVFKEGENITDIVDKGTFKWKVLNKGNPSNLKENSSNLTEDKNNAIIYNEEKVDGNVANIISCSCTVDKKEIFTTLPITIIKSNTENFSNIKLKDNCGFKYVVYSNDGTRPKYDNRNPFELENIKDTQIFKWSIIGDSLKSISKQGLKNYQFLVQPVKNYDGYSVTEAIKCEIDNTVFITIPVHMMLNKYGFAHLNEWDGNSIKISEDEGYILSPQIGAGRKEKNNSFTGLLMGEVKKDNISKIGLLGYDNGVQTIFLDSKTGKAEFGKNGAGQIIIDPSKNKAIIQSGDYKPGLSGMKIDLTTPEIVFGNKKFQVTQNGALESTSGHIGGWKIGVDTLTSEDNSVGMGSKNNNNAFWAGSDKFYVRHDGYLKSTSGEIGGWKIKKEILEGESITLKSNGSIGGYVKNKEGKETSTYWEIDNDGHAIFNDIEANSGTIGGIDIANGDFIGLKSKNSLFSISNAGKLIAKSGEIGGCTINADSISGTGWHLKSSGGDIGGWTIGETGLYVGNNLVDSKIKITTGGYIGCCSLAVSGNKEYDGGLLAKSISAENISCAKLTYNNIDISEKFKGLETRIEALEGSKV